MVQVTQLNQLLEMQGWSALPEADVSFSPSSAQAGWSILGRQAGHAHIIFKDLIWKYFRLCSDQFI
jgi:hypothetical protein